MICDMCGSSGDTFRAEIEGAILTICNKCSKFGKVLGSVRKPVIERKKKLQEPEVMDIVIEDYGAKIRKEREKLGLTQKDFAKKLNEKESLIHKIESGHFKPSIAIARKLQKFLKIKLLEEYEEKHEANKQAKTESFTLGDFIKKR